MMSAIIKPPDLSEAIGKSIEYLERRGKLEVFHVPEELNPFYRNVDIFGVSASSFAGGSKAITVRGLLADAEVRGKLEGVEEFKEATSGNTGLELALQARRYPFNKKVTLVIPTDIPASKKMMLHLAGAKLMLPAEGMSAIETARMMGGGGWSADMNKWKPTADGVLNLDQYANPANSLLHDAWTGPQILNQLERVDIFSTTLGTTGTFGGIARALRRSKAKVVLIGAACAPGHEVPGVRDLKRLGEVSLPWKDYIDFFESVEQKQAYAVACWLCQITGQLVGPSGGMALAALLKVLRKNSKLMGGHRKKAAFFIPDGPERYADRFEANLPGQVFLSGPPKFPLPFDSIWGEWNL